MRFQKTLLAAAAILTIAVPAAAMAEPGYHQDGRYAGERHNGGERYHAPEYRRDYGYQNAYRFHHHRFHRFDERRGW
jgi:Spy/CpxP family protein refolding chaperone